VPGRPGPAYNRAVPGSDRAQKAGFVPGSQASCLLDIYTFDDASTLAAELQAIPWPQSYKPPQLPMYDGQKLKDMLVTSFQGFQTKPVTAQALFQCTQDHEEYLQTYVRRFLRLRAQASTVPNEIVIEAMIKGLRPGPTAQYFARKPPQTLEKLL
jgi:hypothetical protein